MARAASTMRRAASEAASIVISGGASKTASAAGFLGGWGAPGGPLVAALDIIQHVLERDLVAGVAQLQPAAAGADLGAGGDVELGRGVRRDHGADVAPVDHRAARAF